MKNRWQEIESKLRRIKPRLVTAGAIVRKGVSTSGDRWVLRYRQRDGSRWRQRSIHLGDAGMAERARSLIQRWREEAVSPEDRRRKEWLALMDLTAHARGFSRRARARVKAAAVQAFGDPRAELRLVFSNWEHDPLLRDGRPPGRPARSGLW